jgi:hypothetical protein
MLFDIGIKERMYWAFEVIPMQIHRRVRSEIHFQVLVEDSYQAATFYMTTCPLLKARVSQLNFLIYCVYRMTEPPISAVRNNFNEVNVTIESGFKNYSAV